MDCAPYVDDARAGELVLLGGTTGQETPYVHDWYNILSDLNLLAYDHTIAQFVDGVGILLMILAFIWGRNFINLAISQYNSLLK